MIADLWACLPSPCLAIRIMLLALDWIATNARDQLRACGVLIHAEALLSS